MVKEGIFVFGNRPPSHSFPGAFGDRVREGRLLRGQTWSLNHTSLSREGNSMVAKKAPLCRSVGAKGSVKTWQRGSMQSPSLALCCSCGDQVQLLPVNYVSQ